ncbi:glycosyltransferase family 4 protein [Candidatus Dojkabacteria bacterium]|uniref:Glycosyltransferase family 4 protein n=1 Tax=Candidatus Dojkabacteria bacterium TaxID=2099670 RepID=A0A955RLN4_9BACT|nr:glycosyltransferase family 4 protein [Candidatus Dojkabacteria bacterium]
MRILTISPYTYPSACGIWRRVYLDAKSLISNGYQVTSFSSNIIKGTTQTSSESEELNGIKIFRFPVKFRLGGTSMFFFFIKKFREINPDIIHVHGYRHPHSLQGLILGKLMGKKVVLTSHGPFHKDPNRSIIMKLIDVIYDLLIGWWELRLYNKIIAIAEWEISELTRRGAPKSKIVLIPNGIGKEFELASVSPHEEKTNKVLYMGRIEQVKRPEKIIEVAKQLPNTQFTIHGPFQGFQFKDETPSNVILKDKSYEPSEFIQEAKEHDIFLLPSVRESFGIVGLEAMSQGLILLSTRTRGVTQYLSDGENGFLADSAEEIKEKIEYIYANWEKMEIIRENAFDTIVPAYTQERLGHKLFEIYNNLESRK